MNLCDSSERSVDLILNSDQSISCEISFKKRLLMRVCMSLDLSEGLNVLSHSKNRIEISVIKDTYNSSPEEVK